MVKKLIFSVALIIFAILLGMFLSWQYSAARVPAAPQTEVPPSSPAKADSSEEIPADPAPEVSGGEELPDPGSPAAETGYYLRDYNGRIAVFPAGGSEPEMVFDVYTRMLPESDRALLTEGVYVTDYEELTRLVEDYIS